MSPKELNPEERTTTPESLLQRLNLREITMQINSSPSTVSLKIRRNSYTSGTYTVNAAQEHMNVRRAAYRPKRKLLSDS